MDLILHRYELRTWTDIHYHGFGQMKHRHPDYFINRPIISRTKEEGYELAAWFLVSGIQAEVRCLDGDRTPFNIKEGQSFLLTWKPDRKPEVWLDRNNPFGIIHARPPEDKSWKGWSL